MISFRGFKRFWDENSRSLSYNVSKIDGPHLISRNLTMIKVGFNDLEDLSIEANEIVDLKREIIDLVNNIASVRIVRSSPFQLILELSDKETHQKEAALNDDEDEDVAPKTTIVGERTYG